MTNGGKWICQQLVISNFFTDKYYGRTFSGFLGHDITDRKNLKYYTKKKNEARCGKGELQEGEEAPDPYDEWGELIIHPELPCEFIISGTSLTECVPEAFAQ